MITLLHDYDQNSQKTTYRSIGLSLGQITPRRPFRRARFQKRHRRRVLQLIPN